MTDISIGDRVGVGTLSDSCMQCKECVQVKTRETTTFKIFDIFLIVLLGFGAILREGLHDDLQLHHRAWPFKGPI